MREVMTNNSQLKKGWEIKKLGEVCEILDKLRKPITKKNRIAGNYPYYGATGILDYVHDFIFNEKLILIGEDGAKWNSGDRSSFIVTGKYWVNNHAHVVRPYREIILDNWIVYFLNFSDLSRYITGLTVPKLNQGKLKSIEIPTPPLPEQQRIVNILDKAFLAIDKAKQNVQQNISNAKEVFESYLQTTFDNGKLKIDSGEWEEKKLGEVCEVIAGQSPESKFYNTEGDGLPFYQGKKEFTEKYIGEPIKWTTKITKEAKRCDILMSVRAPVGPINFATQKICIGRGLASIRVGELIDRDFLYNFLLKHENEITGNTGAVFNSINKIQIGAIQIPIPPLPEQKQIVKKLDSLQAETKKLEVIYQQKISNMDELKKSILQKAFEGEL